MQPPVDGPATLAITAFIRRNDGPLAFHEFTIITGPNGIEVHGLEPTPTLNNDAAVIALFTIITNVAEQAAHQSSS